jgi:hypothetical protein
MKTEYSNYRDIETYTEEESEYASVPDQDELLRTFMDNDTETIVFHPDDPTTDFLCEIYQGKGWNVVNDPFIDQGTVAELISGHERIICLGHGSRNGLFGGYEMLINESLVPLLRDRELVLVWCNSDVFIKKHDLNASLFSGMFLSQDDECNLFGVPYDDELQIEMSNDWFASILGEHIDSDNILENVKREYYDPDDPIITFNRNRLYSNLQEDNHVT